MPSGALLSIFNGVRLREINGLPFVTSDYKIGVDRGLDLDIPDWAISAKKYCATLGHKCCHSFAPNAEFLVLEHARYKIIYLGKKKLPRHFCYLSIKLEMCK